MSLFTAGLIKGRIIIGALLALGLTGCNEAIEATEKAHDNLVESPAPVIVPLPKQLEVTEGAFVLNEETRFLVRGDAEATIAEFFKDLIAPATGLHPAIIHDASIVDNTIEFALSEGVTAEEGYQLSVQPGHVRVTAATPAGLFYGAQTLRQLLPVAIEKQFPMGNTDWSIPAVEIEDEPRFEYRGMHLDVSRTFFPPKSIKRYIDFIAMHKMNKFHWHLTDNQGWRLEIKKYPRLTGVGSQRRETVIGHTMDRNRSYDGKPHGGYYTQDDVRDIVAYAAARHIDVVPEIDIPGHATAMVVAYPELSCVKAETEVTRSYGIFLEVLCPTETTFSFLDDIFKEMDGLFPYPYVHIGGDEILRDQWEESAEAKAVMEKEGLKNTLELQGYFVKRVEKLVEGYGRKIIGWNEILEGGIDSSAVIMSWTGVQGGIEGAKHGHDVIMTPGTHTYFDQYQSVSLDEPMSIHDFTDLEEVYHYDPIPQELTVEEAKHIKGSQGQIWSEYIHDIQRIEHAILPRMGALAEVVWSPKENRDWAGFQRRLPELFARYEAMDANPSYAIYKPSVHGSLMDSGNMGVSLKAGAGTIIRYTLDGTKPTWQSPVYDGPFVLNESAIVRAVGQNIATGNLHGDARLTFEKHKALGKKIVAGTASELLLDGLHARDRIYQVREWAGVAPDDFMSVIDMGLETLVQRVSVGIEAGQYRKLHRPKAFEVFLSNDNTTWTSVGALDEAAIRLAGNTLTVSFEPTSARYIKIIATNGGTYFSAQYQADKRKNIQIDEISVH